jgi:hypothetical protein
LYIINQEPTPWELSPSSEAASCAVTQVFPNILWNLKVQLQRSKEPSTGLYPEPDESILSLYCAIGTNYRVSTIKQIKNKRKQYSDVS